PCATGCNTCPNWSQPTTAPAVVPETKIVDAPTPPKAVPQATTPETPPVRPTVLPKSEAPPVRPTVLPKPMVPQTRPTILPEIPLTYVPKIIEVVPNPAPHTANRIDFDTAIPKPKDQVRSIAPNTDYSSIVGRLEYSHINHRWRLRYTSC